MVNTPEQWLYPVVTVEFMSLLFLAQMLESFLFIEICQSPRYGHIPILYDQQGNKLSKQTGAAPVDIQTPDQNLKFALRFLNQSTALSDTLSVRDILEHAIDHWNPKAIAPPGV